jgi:two-component system, sensor histidine kinase LadS
MRAEVGGHEGSATVQPLTLPHTLEISFGLVNACIGVAIFLLARRTAPSLSLLLHQRVLRIWVLVALLIVISELVGVLAVFFRSSTLTDVAEDLLELIVLSSVALGLHLLGRVEKEEISSLRYLAEVNELTGLNSRSFFYRAAVRRLELSEANGLPLACIVFDIDNFKDYNDRYGHGAGDRALRCVAKVVHESLRADDIAARYGGEEFVLLISGDLHVAEEVAERVRHRIEVECTPEYDASLHANITVSLGIATLASGTHVLDDLLEAADAAMYRSKRLGKNRLSVAGRS